VPLCKLSGDLSDHPMLVHTAGPIMVRECTFAGGPLDTATMATPCTPQSTTKPTLQRSVTILPDDAPTRTKTLDYTVAIVLVSINLAIGFYTDVSSRSIRNRLDESIIDLLSTEYSDTGIDDAFTLIEQFREKHAHENYAYEYMRLKASKSSNGKSLDRANRKIFQWHAKIMTFYIKNDLHWKSWRERMPGKDVARSFVELLEPLVLAEHSNAEHAVRPTFNWYRKQYGLNVSRFVVDSVRLNSTIYQALAMRSKKTSGKESINRIKTVGPKVTCAVGICTSLGLVHAFKENLGL